MSATQDWEKFFSNWPDSINRRGQLVTVLNDMMPFKNFWLRDGMLLLERTTPDAMGARFVLISFEIINLVKFSDPLREEEIAAAGFYAEEPAEKDSDSIEPELAYK